MITLVQDIHYERDCTFIEIESTEPDRPNPRTSWTHRVPSTTLNFVWKQILEHQPMSRKKKKQTHTSAAAMKN